MAGLSNALKALSRVEFHPSALQNQLENAWDKADFPDAGKRRRGKTQLMSPSSSGRKRRGSLSIREYTIHTTVTLTFAGFDHNYVSISSRTRYLTDGQDDVCHRMVTGNEFFCPEERLIKYFRFFFLHASQRLA